MTVTEHEDIQSYAVQRIEARCRQEHRNWLLMKARSAPESEAEAYWWPRYRELSSD